MDLCTVHPPEADHRIVDIVQSRHSPDCYSILVIDSAHVWQCAKAIANPP